MTDSAVAPTRTGRDGRRATIKDVAEVAGVSRSTASRALTGSGYVGRGVRERVQHAAETLGYVPDAMARHLKQQVSRSIGVLVPDVGSAFGSALVAGVTRQARRHGYATILVGDGTGGSGEVEAAERFVAMRVAGVVVAPLSGEVSAYLARRRTAVVEVGRHFGAGVADAVVVDDEGLSHALTSHLLGLGHRRVALLVDPADWTTGRGRRDGFLAACRDAGLPADDALVVSVPGDVEQARAAATTLLSGPQAPTAVHAAGGPLAAGVWSAAADLGLRVPHDLSVVAFDDAPWMRLVSPGVTAVQRDAVALGEAAVARLLERAAAWDGVPATTVVDARVVQRGSTAPPNGSPRPARQS